MPESILNQLIEKIQSPQQAEAVLAVMASFGSIQEKQHFKPQLIQLRRTLLQDEMPCIVDQMKALILGYYREYGQLSVGLIHFIEKGVNLTESH